MLLQEMDEAYDEAMMQADSEISFLTLWLISVWQVLLFGCHLDPILSGSQSI